MSASSQSTWAELNVKLKRKRDAQAAPTAKDHGTDRRGEAKRPKIESLENACDFQSSGLPSRFMFYDKGEWRDYSDAAVAAVCASFKARKSSVVLSVDGKRYLVNFVQMLQLNLLTGFLRSVAWIDEQNKCFFPSKFVEGHGIRLLPQLHGTSDHRLTDVHSTGRPRGSSSCQDGSLRKFSSVQKSPVETDTFDITLDRGVDGEALRNTQPSAVPVSHRFTVLGDKLVTLDTCGQEFAVVRHKFLAGLGVLASHTIITGIHKDSYTSTSGHARLQVFRKQEEITRKARGDANVKYAWHGTSKQGVSGIVLHGFGQPRIPKNGAMYGVGVYLAPEDYSQASVVYSDIDENGEQHMLLCQAILGSVEQVYPGSEQFHPSSDNYDTGVDDMCNPKRYIVWSTCMNTHIIPVYLVSFKIAPQWHAAISALRGKQTCKNLPVAREPQLKGQSTTKQCTFAKVENALSIKPSTASGSSPLSWSRAPRSPWISFPMLLLVMKSKLPTGSMDVLQQHYLEYKSGRIPRDVLVKNVRTIVGDHTLADSIKSMQSQEAGAVAWG